MQRSLNKNDTAFFKRLKDDRSGLALTEFALSLPIMMTMLASGAELSNYAVVQTTVSQVGVQLADNGTRIGTANDAQVYELNESQVNDILDGADQHAGGLDLYGTHQEDGETVGNGKVVISSVIMMDELTADDEPQYEILWQRCRGESDYAPNYGRFGQSSGSNIEEGIGPVGQKAFPPDTFNQLIFVEVQYRYQPLFLNAYMVKDYSDIRTTAALLVRDNRKEEAPTNNAAAYLQCNDAEPEEEAEA